VYNSTAASASGIEKNGEWLPGGSTRSPPRWARAARGKLQYFHRAIVQPGGAIEFVDDAGEWLAEQGL
jgi:hypothetical protein